MINCYLYFVVRTIEAMHLKKLMALREEHVAEMNDCQNRNDVDISEKDSSYFFIWSYIYVCLYMCVCYLFDLYAYYLFIYTVHECMRDM